MTVGATIALNPAEIEFSAIRAQGPLPDFIKERLLALADQRITQNGVVVLKAQQSRSLEQNKEDALRRLQELVDSVAVLPALRRPTRPTRSSQRKRLDSKTRSSQTKALRGRVTD